jgi:hypothetical protein
VGRGGYYGWIKGEGLKMEKGERLSFLFVFVDRCLSFVIFSSLDPKGHVSYCHHLASVVRP